MSLCPTITRSDGSPASLTEVTQCLWMASRHGIEAAEAGDSANVQFANLMAEVLETNASKLPPRLSLFASRGANAIRHRLNTVGLRSLA